MKDASSIPSEVRDLLQSSDVAYLSVTSPKGELYSYPIAFHFSGSDVSFVTPVSSAKLKFIRANPRVSLIVDNRKLTRDAVGSLLQGDAQVFTLGKFLTSAFSVARTVRGFTKKYPGMLTFYARGKELPDERKLHKYRLIRITPKSILYWVGYKYGRYVPKKAKKPDREAEESALEALSGLIGFQEETPMPEKPVTMDGFWLTRLDEVISKGGVSDDERRIIRSFTKVAETSEDFPHLQSGSKVRPDEKAILRKWRSSSIEKD